MRPGTVVGGRFEIERHAGSGGIGAVYRAIDRVTLAPVAFKILHDPTPGRVDRLVREAETLAALEHPAIVRYVAHGTAPDGRVYLAMEWLEGETLSARLARRGLTVAETLALGRAVAGALAAAHRMGIVHRDVKPSNLLLAGGEASAAKILDFGIAHLRGGRRRLTETGEMLGTPGYMAPEQARGESGVDARSDVFSLGCVLFECLTGRMPFEGDGPMMVLLKVVLEEAPRASSLRADVPPAIDELVAHMLAKAPAARPADAAAVEAELGAMAGAPEEAAPISIKDAPTLTSRERRVVCLVLARPATGGGGEARLPALRAAVERHEGRLDALADGSLVATLYAAGAATDLAERAARCALVLAAALPGVPIALATGRGAGQGQWAMGELIDRAVGLHAKPGFGGVRVDEVTAGLLGPGFEVRGDATGLALTGERADAAVGRTLLGKPTPCVGREREISLLAGLYAECEEEPGARAAVVLGVAGVGKSRLRDELLRRARAARPELEVWFGRGDAMSAGSPFGMLAQAVRRAAGVRDGEPLEARRGKLRARIGRHLAGKDLARVAEFVGELAGVPFPDDRSPELSAARQSAVLMGDQIRRAFGDMLEAELSAGPLVLVLEDLHWGDRPTVELCDGALRNLAEQPLFVLALGRPEVSALFPGLWAERRTQVLRLGELSRRASRELVTGVLGERVDADTVRLIVERAAGNAFYLEELIRAAAEGATSAFPETVLAMAEKRLEGLDAEDRRILRAASVFGRVFWRGGLAELIGAEGPASRALSGVGLAASLDERIADLLRRELIQRRRAPRFPGEEEYAFRHALLREAAYGMLTERDRAVGHRLAGEWLEREGEGDAVVLAEHFDRGERPARSIAWYRRAAEQALEGNDFAGAIACVKRAEDAGAEGEVKGALLRIRAEACSWVGDNVAASAAALAAMRRLPPGERPWCQAAADLLMLSVRRNDTASAAAVAQEIEGLEVVALSDHHLLLIARLVTYLYTVGQAQRGAALLAAIEGPADRPGVPDQVLAWVHHARSWQKQHDDDAAQALRFEELAVACFDHAGDQRSACNMRVNLGVAYKEVGAFAPAEVLLREALRTAERMGLTGVLNAAWQNLGIVLAAQGALVEAEAVERAAVAGFAADANPRMEGGSHIYLAMIRALAGDREEAEREARRAVEMLAPWAPMLPPALSVLAEILLARESPREALEVAEEALAVVRSMGGVPEGESLTRLVHAEALHALGDPGARAALAEARRRLLDRAARIGEEALRESFLRSIPENARTLALARERLGDEG